MSQRSFWGGLLAGGLIGMAIAIAMAPQLKPETREKIMTSSKHWSGRAGKLLSKGRDAVMDATDNLH
ncbi:MAG: hypothetical protein ACYC6V_01355 [Bacillota bacterium]